MHIDCCDSHLKTFVAEQAVMDAEVVSAVADDEEGPTGQWRVNGVALSDWVELEDGADSEGGADPDEEAFLAIPELGQPDQVMLAISIKGKTCLGMQHVSSKHANTDT